MTYSNPLVGSMKSRSPMKTHGPQLCSDTLPRRTVATPGQEEGERGTASMSPSLPLPTDRVEAVQVASLGSRRPVSGIGQDPKRYQRVLSSCPMDLITLAMFGPGYIKN